MVQVCPLLKANGSCSDELCRFNHDVRICEDCDVLCTSVAAYNAHIQGKKHRSKVLGLSTLFRCPLCRVSVYGPVSWNQHVTGGPHQREAALQGVPAHVEPEGAGDIYGQMYCGLCDRHIPTYLWSSHAQGAAHRQKERVAAYKTALNEAEKNKHGVTVSEGINFRVVDVADARNGVSLHFTVDTTIPASRVSLMGYKLSMSTTRTSPYVRRQLWYAQVAHIRCNIQIRDIPTPWTTGLWTPYYREDQVQRG